jgi:hypothetical protein
MMDLDRGTLARIDRKLLSELGHTETWQMVRVPASAAMWATWRRYCAALGISMGRAIARLIVHELGAVASAGSELEAGYASELHRRLVARAEELDVRERTLDEREGSLRASERLLRARTRPFTSSGGPKVGRNDPCPCGSGFKFKRCHDN